MLNNHVTDLGKYKSIFILGSIKTWSDVDYYYHIIPHYNTDYMVETYG